MFVTFDTVRREVLLSLYRLTYYSDKQEYFSKEEIADKISLSVGSVFLSRALRGLVGEDLVENSDFENDEYHYLLTNAGWAAAEKLALSGLKDGEPVEGVPASDRVVSIDDNQRSDIDGTIEKLAAEIQTSNEIGAALGDSRPRIEAELEAGRRLILPKFVRIDAIVAVLATPLRYLMEKFSGAAVGELAKKLLDLLWKMINS
ncbi:hypothetical protein VH567_03310 [Sphingomonas sp. 4RDLI-65]|uniref:hypothetical protein n=1 Tax=Sphingomonas sp. 4RDLI-65 TaxID=3111641 RepID=UPI003C1C9C75